MKFQIGTLVHADQKTTDYSRVDVPEVAAQFKEKAANVLNAKIKMVHFI